MKSFGHRRPVRDEAGAIIDSKPSPVRVRTIAPLGYGYGTDRNKRLVLTAHAQDVIGLRPERTTRELTITAVDLYAHLIRCAANRTQLDRARQRKDRKAARLAALRQQRAEKRLFKK